MGIFFCWFAAIHLFLHNMNLQDAVLPMSAAVMALPPQSTRGDLGFLFPLNVWILFFLLEASRFILSLSLQHLICL